MLVVVCGLPGTGKSTVSERVAGRLDAHLLRTDVVRKELFPDPDYTSAESQAVYDEILDRAASHLDAGDDVVLDGTFRRASMRERAAGVAERCGADLRLVRVTCAESVVKRRIQERVDDESDADFSIYKLLKDEFEPIERDHLVIDNSGSLAETEARIDEGFAPVVPE